QAHAAMGKGNAHWLAVGRAMQIDVATEGIHVTEQVEAALTAGQPEDAREYPVAPRMLLMQLGAPDLTGPAPSAQHRRKRQTRADSRTNPMHAARRAARAIAFAGTIERGGHAQTQTQFILGEAIEHLVREGYLQQI